MTDKVVQNEVNDIDPTQPTDFTIEVKNQLDYLPSYSAESGVDIVEPLKTPRSSLYLNILFYLAKLQSAALWLLHTLASTSHHHHNKPSNAAHMTTAARIIREDHIQQAMDKTLESRQNKVFMKVSHEHLDEKVKDKYHQLEKGLSPQSEHEYQAYDKHRIVNVWSTNTVIKSPFSFKEKTFKLISFTVSAAQQARKYFLNWTKNNNTAILADPAYKIIKGDATLKPTRANVYHIYTEQGLPNHITFQFDQLNKDVDQQKNHLFSLVLHHNLFNNILKKHFPEFNLKTPISDNEMISKLKQIHSADLVELSQEFILLSASTNQVDNPAYEAVLKFMTLNHRVCRLGSQIEKKTDRLALIDQENEFTENLKKINFNDRLNQELNLDLRKLELAFLHSDMTLTEYMAGRIQCANRLLTEKVQPSLEDGSYTPSLNVANQNPASAPSDPVENVIGNEPEESVDALITSLLAPLMQTIQETNITDNNKLALTIYITNKIDEIKQACPHEAQRGELVDRISHLSNDLLTIMKPVVISTMIARFKHDDVIDNDELKHFLDEKLAHIAQRSLHQINEMYAHDHHAIVPAVKPAATIEVAPPKPDSTDH